MEENEEIGVKHQRMRELMALESERELTEAEQRELITLSIELGPMLMRTNVGLCDMLQRVSDAYEKAHKPVMDFFDRAYERDQDFAGLAEAAEAFESVGIELELLDPDEPDGSPMEEEEGDEGYGAGDDE